MSKLHGLSDYIMKRGLFLSCALLAAAIVMLVWASARPADFFILQYYSKYLQFSAVIVTAAALIGGLLLEDILRKNNFKG